MKGKIISMLVLVFVSTGAMATGLANKYSIDYVRVDNNGKGFVRFTSALQDTPATCTNPTYANMLSFDSNTAGGQAILSLVLSAKASGAFISARGTGTCTIYNNTMENWAWGFVR
jgi:hypothetical protein